MAPSEARGPSPAESEASDHAAGSNRRTTPVSVSGRREIREDPGPGLARAAQENVRVRLLSRPRVPPTTDPAPLAASVSLWRADWSATPNSTATVRRRVVHAPSATLPHDRSPSAQRVGGRSSLVGSPSDW